MFGKRLFPVLGCVLGLSGCATGFDSPSKSEPHATLRMERSLTTMQEPDVSVYQGEEIILQFYWQDDGNNCEGRKILSNLGPFSSKKEVRLAPNRPIRFLARNAYGLDVNAVRISQITGKYSDSYSCSAYGEFIPDEGRFYVVKLTDRKDGKCELSIDETSNSTIRGLTIDNNVCPTSPSD